MLIGARYYFATKMIEEAPRIIMQPMQDFSQQMIKEAQENQRRIQEQQALATQKAKEQKQIETAQLKQEKRLKSPECQFWWQQNEQNPTERTAAKKAQYCAEQ